MVRGRECESPRTEELDIPQLDRSSVLLYLIDRLGRLSRIQVGQLAEVLYADSPSPRPLVEVCHQAGLTKGDKSFSADRFLARVTLKYDKSEMEEQLSVKDMQSVVDVLAGSGAPRPLLLDIYSLQPLGLVVIGGYDGEVFLPTYRGSAGAEALRVIFDHIDFRGGLGVEVGPLGMRAFSIGTRPH